MKKLKIGWSDWIESLNPDSPSASGARNWCMNAWKRLKKAGHEVYFLQEIHGYGDYEPSKWVNVDYAVKSGDSFPELDIVFMAHRWKVPGHPERWGPYFRQEEILQHYYGKIPVIMHDEDLTVDKTFEETFPHVVIAEPSLNPMAITRQRYRLYFPMHDDETVFYLKSHRSRPYDLIYVGNNYNRLDMAKKYYARGKELGLSTLFVGNWMLPSPERPSPSKVKEALPGVEFMTRVPPTELLKVNMLGAFTVHIAPLGYAKRGFLTGRWAEAAQYGIVSFIPEDFSSDARAIFGDTVVVNSDVEVSKLIRFIKRTDDKRPGLMRKIATIQSQRVHELGIFHVDEWLKELGNAAGVKILE